MVSDCSQRSVILVFSQALMFAKMYIMLIISSILRNKICLQDSKSQLEVKDNISKNTLLRTSVD